MKGSLEDLKKRLAGDDWPGVLVLGGDDDEARERALGVVIGAIPEDERAIGVERFADAPCSRVLDAARTAPLLGGRRVVVVSDIDWLSAGGDERAQKELSSYLQHPPGHALLVLIAPKADRRLAVVKAIEKDGFLLDCPLPKEREMPAWLTARGRERGLALSPAAAQLLADAVGTDTAVGARELDKLALLVHVDGAKGLVPVEPAQVEEALGPARAVGAFQLEDALLAGRGADALEAMSRQLSGSDSGVPLMLLGRISSVVRRLSLAAGVVARGGGEQDVHAVLGGHPFVAQKYAQAARRVGPRAERAMAACVAADGMLKSGRDPHAALTRVVLALAAPERRA